MELDLTLLTFAGAVPSPLFLFCCIGAPLLLDAFASRPHPEIGKEKGNAPTEKKGKGLLVNVKDGFFFFVLSGGG